MKRLLLIIFVLCSFYPIDGFAQKKVTVIEPEKSTIPEGKVLKRKVAIGRFSNETQYAKGIFYDKANDPMGKQALDILSSKLAATNKFILIERSDLASLLVEATRGDANSQKTIGADYLIIGSITEFGRKNTGQTKVFSTTKTQTVEASVNIRLVDVATGLIISSAEAKGDAEQTTKSTMGLGGQADFDATLSDKAISAAISQLVENIINKCTDKAWRSYFLSYDNDAILISGGKSQGLEVGSTFNAIKKGKSVKNPQTGLMIELPGKVVGKVQITMTGGDTPESEYSIVTFTDGNIDRNNLNDYFIEEVKL
jgi:curli biogenesis system outer membrane secretion channel CsgG